MQSPIGTIGVAANDKAVTRLFFGEDIPKEGFVRGSNAVTDEALRQLGEYFAGSRRTFDLPLAPAGTEFQRKVWDALMRIPYGSTNTYTGVAAAVGSPKACRAVGSANNRNPIAIIIPCHRVIGADGSLTGYAPGTGIKKILLELEKAGA